jgi:hypothetical protein
MLELRNRTPYPAMVVPGLDREGRDFATVVIKVTFALGEERAGATLVPVAEEQVPIVLGDEFYGDPGVTSIQYESEVGPEKSGTDVALVGQAHVPRDQVEATELDVTLDAGPLRKVVRVFGDRRWQHALKLSRMTSPKPFESMPLVYERAFGGVDVSHRKEKKHVSEARNPVGTGFTTAGKGDHFDGLALPNLEDPDNLIGRPRHKPPPAGFGFIGGHWEPRKSFVGTYDEAWQQSRCPLLPADFDERFFRSAHPDLCAPNHFQGGERVRVVNAWRAGELIFQVPGIRWEVKSEVKGAVQLLEPRIDTLLIEPDEDRASLIWKATLPCPRELLYVKYVRVRELERFA